MQFPRKNLANFDLYPFVTVACDSKGFVIYKNELTRKLYQNIHIGARLSSYTDIALIPSRIESAKFYGNSCTLFICNLEDDDGDYTVITIFSIGFCSMALYQDSVAELKSAVTNLLKHKDAEASLEKRSFLRDVARKQELAKKCGLFISSYLENQSLFSYDVVNVANFISRVVNVINNRLGFDIKLELCDLSETTPHIKISKATALILLNLINFTILNSNRDIKVSVSTDIKTVNVSFEYFSKHIFQNIFPNDEVAYYTFMLLTGIDLAEKNNIRISFANQNDVHRVKTEFPLIIQKGLKFNSYNSIDEMIEEYIELSIALFKD